MNSDDLRYKFDELKSRFIGADRRKLLAVGGGVALLTILMIVAAIIWLPEPGPSVSKEDKERAQEISSLATILAEDSRFAFIQVVASADERGKVRFQLMGSVASKGDLEALRSVVSAEKPNSDVSWAVGISPPDA